MGLKDLLEGPHLVVLVLIFVVLFGWKKMPDAARGLGRSMRIFKSEVDQMKSDGTATSSAASSDTVESDKVKSEKAYPSEAAAEPNLQPAGESEHDGHNETHT